MSASVVNDGSPLQPVPSGPDGDDSRARRASSSSTKPASIWASDDDAGPERAVARRLWLECDHPVVEHQHVQQRAARTRRQTLNPSGRLRTRRRSARTRRRSSTAIQSFVTNYNNFISQAQTLTAFNTTTDTAPPLEGSPTVTSAESQLNSLITQPFNSSEQPGANACRLGHHGQLRRLALAQPKRAADRCCRTIPRASPASSRPRRPDSRPWPNRRLTSITDPNTGSFSAGVEHAAGLDQRLPEPNHRAQPDPHQPGATALADVRQPRNVHLPNAGAGEHDFADRTFERQLQQ